MFIDLHSHLDICKDIPKAIENCKKADVKIAVTTGIFPESTEQAIELAKKYDIVKYTIGIYPLDSLETEFGRKYDVDINDGLDLIRKKKDEIIAIGEIGLDYKTDSDKEAQADLFRKQLKLAKELGKPVVTHSRKAEADVLDILEQFDGPVIMHCFSGKKKLVHRAQEAGLYFTIPTCVVRSQQFQYLAEVIPLSHLFCETDAPFLSPFKDIPNEPVFVVEAYKKIAEIKGLELKEVANIIYANYQKVFL